MEVPQLDAEALNVMVSYNWPGNIRELRNFAENIVVLHRGGTLTAYDLDSRFREGVPVVQVDSRQAPNLSVEENEKHLLRKALVQSNGNRTRAAQLMGISRRTLHRKLIQWPELDTTGRAGKNCDD